MRFRLDPSSPSGVSVVVEQQVIQQVRQANGYVINKVTGLISAGTNITISGTGTADDPYVISVTGGGVWGDITGNLSDQTDLQVALDAKADKPPTLERRADLTHGAIAYIGLAPDGTSDAVATWTIYKFDTSDVENITRLTATVATWNNRLTETYS